MDLVKESNKLIEFFCKTCEPGDSDCNDCMIKFQEKIKKLCVDFAKSKVPEKTKITKETILFNLLPYYEISAYNRAIDDFNKKINEEL